MGLPGAGSGRSAAVPAARCEAARMRDSWMLEAASFECDAWFVLSAGAAAVFAVGGAGVPQAWA
jgi:hypothetical protein